MTTKMTSIFAIILFVWPGALEGARGEDVASTVLSTDSTGVLCRHYSGNQDAYLNQEMDQLVPSLFENPNQHINISVQGVITLNLRNKPSHMLTNCVPLCIVAGHSYGTIMK